MNTPESDSNFNFQVLKRYPYRKNDSFQAWDAGDELLLEYARTLNLQEKRVLVIQDSFGAVTRGLLELHPSLDLNVYTDSYVSSRGIEINTGAKVKTFNPLNQWSGVYDFVFIKIPKNTSFFEDILCRLTQHLNETSQVICAYMIKHQSKASFDLLNRLIGETTTSLARKKARLIFTTFQKSATSSPYPLQIPIEGFGSPFIQHSNLFSREKLDIGTRFFLEHIPNHLSGTLLDLGCGNGIIGIEAKRRNPDIKVVFTDDSQMAILSAEENYRRQFSDANLKEAEFHWTHCFESGAPHSIDFVLCNPPFHQGTTVGEHVAVQMFRDAYRTLKPGGGIRVIGNSHLKYHWALKKIFGNSEVIATHPKFMIIDAFKEQDDL